jgi:hypothetical protein
LFAGGGEALGIDLAGLQVIEHDGLRRRQLRTGSGHGRRDLVGNGGHAIAVAMDQVARCHHHPADMDRNVDLDDMTVTVGTERTRAKAREVERLHLVDVPAGSAGDQPCGTESLIGGTHDLAERGRRHRVIEVLEHDHGRSRQLRE